MPAALWAVVIMVLLSLPPNDYSEWSWRDVIPYADKWVHAFLFGVQAFLLAYGLKRVWSVKRFFIIILTAALLSGVYGIATEILQALFFTGREADIWDAVADLAGVCAGIAVFLFGRRLILRSERKKSRTV